LVRRHIGARSYWVHRRIGIGLVGSQGILVAIVIGFIAAVDTGSSFFLGCLRDYAVPTAPPPTSLSLYGTLHENFLSGLRW
jgi:hypothetical protein